MRTHNIGQGVASTAVAFFVTLALLPMQAIAKSSDENSESISPTEAGIEQEADCIGADEIAVPQNADIASGVSGTCSWKVTSAGELVIAPTSGNSGTLESITTTAPWEPYCASIKSATISGKIKTGASAVLFNGLYKLVSFTGIRNLDTSNATDMNYMFDGCEALKSIDLGGFDTSNVTDMEFMFKDCSSLTSLDLTSFNTSKVRNMCDMFEGDTSLVSVDLSSFDTSSVENVDWMFYKCPALKSLDLSMFNTSKMVGLSFMFYGCSSLISIKFPVDMDTSSAQDMDGMFNGCSSLKEIDVSKFNTSKLNSFMAMFRDCSSLTSLDLSSFDTSNVTYMPSVFYGCTSLVTLDLSNFIVSGNVYCPRMFKNCSSLRSLDLSGFDTTKSTDMTEMLAGCTSLQVLAVGPSFSFNGDGASETVAATMPSPAIQGATSLWISKSNGEKLTCAQVVQRHCAAAKTADTLYAEVAGKKATSTSLVSGFKTPYTGKCVAYAGGATVAEVSGGIPIAAASVTYAYSNSKEGTYTLTRPSTVGTWWVKGTYVGDADYAASESDAVSFDIVKTTGGVVRLSGDDRYGTMAAIVQCGFPAGGCSTVILATGADFPDALAASGLAGLYGSPVILIDGKLTNAVDIANSKAFSEIERLKASNVVVVGGEAAVSADIYAQLVSHYGKAHVTRCFGQDRTDTALKIYEAGKSLAHGSSKGWSKTVVVATGKSFADALSISPFCYATASPIVLTDEAGNLSNDSKAAISNSAFEHAVIVGGSLVVSADTQMWLEGVLGSEQVVRLGGAERYETSEIIADFSSGQRAYASYPGRFGYAGLGYSWPGIATGENFPDALAGAVLCGRHGSTLLLVSNGSSPTLPRLAMNRGMVGQALVFGGEAAVSNSVFSAVKLAIS